jgi:hypothetical protein
VDALELKIKSIELEIAKKEDEYSQIEQKLQKTLTEDGPATVILVMLGVIPFGIVLFLLSIDLSLSFLIMLIVLLFPIVRLRDRISNLNQEKERIMGEKNRLRDELGKLLESSQ